MTGEIGCVLNLQEELHKIVIGYQFKRMNLNDPPEMVHRSATIHHQDLKMILEKRYYLDLDLINNRSYLAFYFELSL